MTEIEQIYHSLRAMQVLTTLFSSIGIGTAMYLLLNYRVKKLEAKLDNGLSNKIDQVMQTVNTIAKDVAVAVVRQDTHQDLCREHRKRKEC